MPSARRSRDIRRPYARALPVSGRPSTRTLSAGGGSRVAVTPTAARAARAARRAAWPGRPDRPLQQHGDDRHLLSGVFADELGGVKTRLRCAGAPRGPRCAHPNFQLGYPSGGRLCPETLRLSRAPKRRRLDDMARLSTLWHGKKIGRTDSDKFKLAEPCMCAWKYSHTFTL